MGPGNRPLDLEWLEDFLALCESGNFSRAAEARAIAQPAFSRHIRALEEWVGVDLFDRSAHPTVLTPAGQRFKPLLEDVLARLEDARMKARAANSMISLEPLPKINSSGATPTTRLGAPTSTIWSRSNFGRRAETGWGVAPAFQVARQASKNSMPLGRKSFSASVFTSRLPPLSTTA